MYVVVAVLALVGLVGLVVFDMVKNVFAPSPLLVATPNTEIVYRHPAMYTGADMSFQRPAYSGPTVNSHAASSSVAASPVVASPVAPSVSTSSPSMSARVRTTSSQSPHSYGGGAAASGNSTSSEHVASSMASPASSVPMASMSPRIGPNTRSTVSPLAEAGRVAGPRRAYGPDSETDGFGNYYDEEEEDWLPIPGAGHFVGETKIEDGLQYQWNGSEWILAGDEVMEPVGDGLMILLLLALAYFVKNMRQSLAYLPKKL